MTDDTDAVDPGEPGGSVAPGGKLGTLAALYIRHSTRRTSRGVAPGYPFW
jgi:hypothetical protein